jgi:phenylalanyl-tRNA synthetase alpha chain
MDDLERQAAQALAGIEQAETLDTLESLRVGLLGKSGIVTAALKTLGTLAPEQRKARGAEVNRVKERLVDALATRKAVLEQAELDHRLASEAIDISLPGRDGERGGIHPITRALERIASIFARLGYQRADGPEIEDDWHNFEALNFPPHHPARAMHDTFYFGDGRLLRTHTSPVQIRTMAGRQPPIRIIAPGKVYRSDSDQTHSPMFHQIEGLLVDETSSFADPRAPWPSSSARSSNAISRCVSAPAISPLPSLRPRSTSAGRPRMARAAGWRCSAAAWCIRTC